VGEPAPDQPVLKGAIHIHTTCSDGELSPAEVLRVYRDLGFDFVALTDHDFLMTPDSYDTVPDEFEGMLVFKGTEKTLFARGYLHVNRIPGDREILHVFNHPAQYDLTAAQVVHRINELEQSVVIDAVEVTDNGYYTPEYDVPEIPHPKVASDDSHSRQGCGRAWIEVPCRKDRDAILRSVKEGRARMVYRGTAHRRGWADQKGRSCD
jgi:hypothetical protein